MKQRRGSILLQAMILIVLLAMAGGMTLSFLLGRAMAVEKVSATERDRFLAQAANSKLNDCLQNVTAASCNNAALGACGFPMKLGGKTITAAASWKNPSCEVTVKVPD